VARGAFRSEKLDFPQMKIIKLFKTVTCNICRWRTSTIAKALFFARIIIIRTKRAHLLILFHPTFHVRNKQINPLPLELSCVKNLVAPVDWRMPVQLAPVK
jgi:hypothetical protein